MIKHKVVNNVNVAYMYSLNRETKKIYAKLKNKSCETINVNLSESEKVSLIAETVSALNDYVIDNNIELIILPESNNVLLRSILSYVNLPLVIINKKNKEMMVDVLNTELMQKAEREKLMNSIENMSTVKIAQISANQRKRVADKLFHVENVSVFKNKKVLFFDDALFTGSTLFAIKKMVDFNHAFVLFSFD